MPYNLELEKKIDQMAASLGIDNKKKMFGGIGYRGQGKMAFGVHKNWLIVRTTPPKAQELLKLKGVSIFEITGRPMKGWLKIEPEALDTFLILKDLLAMGVDYVSHLSSQS